MMTMLQRQAARREEPWQTSRRWSKRTASDFDSQQSFEPRTAFHHTPKNLLLQQMGSVGIRFPLGFTRKSRSACNLDLRSGESQTERMAHIYIRFDFGTDEEKAQQARHKLDGWKQAFRLDKRLLYKLDRPESDPGEASAKPDAEEKAGAAAKSKGKTAEKPKGRAAGKASDAAAEKPATAPNGKVGLLVRLYFSSHEKLSEQRWLARIPSEEPFKSAAPKIVHQDDKDFDATDKQFESLG